jgi:hypothetical protein
MHSYCKNFDKVEFLVGLKGMCKAIFLPSSIASSFHKTRLYPQNLSLMIDNLPGSEMAEAELELV